MAATHKYEFYMDFKIVSMAHLKERESTNRDKTKIVH